MNRIRLALLALAVVLWTSLAAAPTEHLLGWSPGLQNQRRRPWCGQHGHDRRQRDRDGSSRQAGPRRWSGAWFPAGTYKTLTGIGVPSNLAIFISPLATI